MTDAAMKYRLQENADYGFFQVSPTPSAEDITRFYADEFYSGQYRGFRCIAYGLIRMIDCAGTAYSPS